jgi:hypothetical protein
MALQIASANDIGIGTRLNLSTTDDAWILPGVTVGSTNSFAIFSSGSAQTIHVEGTVIGEDNAIYMGDSAADTGQKIVIDPGGSLIGGGADGAAVTGFGDIEIRNDGLI